MIQADVPPAHVQVSVLDLEADGPPCAELERRLDDEERARARRLRSPVDRRRFLRRRAHLRDILSGRLGCAPDSLRYLYGPWGKPALTDHALGFSVSHSAGRALICLSDEADVGCDIERLDAGFDRHDFALAGVLTAMEASRLAAEPAASAYVLFFEMWTLKEAALKCLGVGLSQDASTLDIPAEDTAPPGAVSAAALALVDGFASAVAWRPRSAPG